MPKLLEEGAASPITVLVSEHCPERGGVVFEGTSGHVERFSYEPTPRLEHAKIWNWTGASLISKPVTQACILAAQDMRNLAPLEALFQCLIDRHVNCAVATTGDFYNLNTYDELMLCQQRLSQQEKCTQPERAISIRSPLSC
jgi:hypothetical protein